MCAFTPIPSHPIHQQSIDQLELEIKQRVGTPSEQKYAKRLLPILNRRHLLLVTLLLFNASAAEALPLFLGAF
jgi:metal transporter CNNM